MTVSSLKVFSFAAAVLVLGVPFSIAAHARDLQPGMQTMIQEGGVEGVPLGTDSSGGAEDDNLQPGMRTMIQQGGTEGVLLGALLPGLGAEARRDGWSDGAPRPAASVTARHHRHHPVLHVRN